MIHCDQPVVEPGEQLLITLVDVSQPNGVLRSAVNITIKSRTTHEVLLERSALNNTQSNATLEVFISGDFPPGTYTITASYPWTTTVSVTKFQVGHLGFRDEINTMKEAIELRFQSNSLDPTSAVLALNTAYELFNELGCHQLANYSALDVATIELKSGNRLAAFYGLRQAALATLLASAQPPGDDAWLDVEFDHIWPIGGELALPLVDSDAITDLVRVSGKVDPSLLDLPTDDPLLFVLSLLSALHETRPAFVAVLCAAARLHKYTDARSRFLGKIEFDLPLPGFCDIIALSETGGLSNSGDLERYLRGYEPIDIFSKLSHLLAAMSPSNHVRLISTLAAIWHFDYIVNGDDIHIVDSQGERITTLPYRDHVLYHLLQNMGRPTFSEVRARVMGAHG
jgi:hypothetical protein